MVKQSERVGFRLHSMLSPSACSELCGQMEAVYKVCLQWVSEPLLLVVLLVREPATDRQTTQSCLHFS